jgi:predicted nucleic acid-binding protein
MPQNIAIDLNIIMDVLLERSGFLASQRILQLAESGGYDLYISAHIVTTFAYLLEAAKVPRPEIARQLDWLLQTFQTVPATSSVLKAAQKSKITDFEDAVIEQAALAANASVIITRNVKDFTASAVVALTPEVYLSKRNEPA